MSSASHGLRGVSQAAADEWERALARVAVLEQENERLAKHTAVIAQADAAVQEASRTVADLLAMGRSLVAMVEAERAARAQLVERVRALRNAGGLLSNSAYNLAQNPALDERTRHTLDECRRHWDDTVRESNAGEVTP